MQSPTAIRYSAIIHGRRIAGSFDADNSVEITSTRTAVPGLTSYKSRSGRGVLWEPNMEPRRWLPYRNLQSRHLGLALATARVIAWIGMLLVVAGIAYGIAAAVSRGASVPTALGMVIGLIGYGLAALVLSGGLAALLGIEDSQRRQVDRD